MVLAVVNYHIWQQSWLSQRVSLLGRCDGTSTSSPVQSYLLTGRMILLRAAFC